MRSPRPRTEKRMPDYMFQLESRLSPEQRAAMVRIQELAAESEANVYLVGGAVRDVISGMAIRDLDFTVEGNPSRIVRELEKGGAKVIEENDAIRSSELVLAGEVDASISAAREEVYPRPGAKPEARFSTIMEDLRRRDFSINAIAISLNANSRGLLLDPTNGLADLERREIRALSIHSFTNQPVRLLRALRYEARMGFKMESRTKDWFSLAMERKLQDSISVEDAGSEFRQVAREEKPAAILKSWESQGLLGMVSPVLAKRHPDYDAINRIFRVREDLVSSGMRPRLYAPVTVAILGRLKDGERKSVLARMDLPSGELRAVQEVEPEAAKVVKILTGPKTAAARDAYAYLEKAPLDLLAYILAESSNNKAVGKIRTHFQKWRPLRQALPGVANELELLGMPRGPKFDKVVEDFFQLQLLGRARKPEDHAKVLRKLAGIKELPKKPEEKKKPEKPKKKGEAGGKPETAAAGPVTPPKIPPHRMAQGRPAPAPSPGKSVPVPSSKPKAKAKKK
jgi:tRNA nucleotidyltransferase (CCA-adding enzyme)